MEIQNPFIIDFGPAFDHPKSFPDFILERLSQYGDKLALCDSDLNMRWRFSDIRPAVENCRRRLHEMNVTASSRVALICSTTVRVLFVHLAGAQLGTVIASINGWSPPDEIWGQLDVAECTHAVVEAQFSGKVDELRRKALMRGFNRCRIVRTLEEVLGDQRITRPVRATINHGQSTVVAVAGAPAVEVIDSPTMMGKSHELDYHTHGSGSARATTPTSKPTSVKDFPIGANERSKSLASTKSLASACPSPLSGSRNNLSPIPSRPILIFFTLCISPQAQNQRPIQIVGESLVRNLMQLSSASAIFGAPTPTDRVLLPISVHHIFGTMSLYYSLINGASVFTLPRYSPKALLDGLATHKITRVHLTTAIAQLLGINGEGEEEGVTTPTHSSTLQTIIVGGARFDAGIAKLCREKFPNAQFKQMYVTSEFGCICTFTPLKCECLESVGIPLPAMSFRIVTFNNARCLCAPRQLGQLLLSGPQLMPSIYKDHKATNELYVDNKFIKTGDAAYYDEHGCIFIMDRISDIISYKGTLLCPSEVESALRSHVGIEDCAVVGRYSTGALEAPAAFIVRSPLGLQLNAKDIKEHLSGKMENVAEFAGGIFFVSEIPRSVGGRILRRSLKQYCDRERLAGTTTSQPNQSSPKSRKELGSRSDSIAYISAPMIAHINGKMLRQPALGRVSRMSSSSQQGSVESEKSATTPKREPHKLTSVSNSDLTRKQLLAKDRRTYSNK